jgi:hypothetical protein
MSNIVSTMTSLTPLPTSPSEPKRYRRSFTRISSRAFWSKKFMRLAAEWFYHAFGGSTLSPIFHPCADQSP